MLATHSRVSFRVHFKASFKVCCLLLLASLLACTSSGPATQYYSLFAERNVQNADSEMRNKALSFGVGPLIIPEYMDNPNIVSVNDRQQVNISGRHAWAGDLKSAMGRVVADNLAQYWRLDKVSAFPWDNRVRPDYQIRLVFDEFGGARGGEVRLRVSWTLLNKQGDKVRLTERVALKATTENDSAKAYVSTLNQLLNQFSARVAVDVAGYLR